MDLDKLSIKISAEADSAIKSLDSLIDKLDDLSKALSQVKGTHNIKVASTETVRLNQQMTASTKSVVKWTKVFNSLCSGIKTGTKTIGKLTAGFAKLAFAIPTGVLKGVIGIDKKFLSAAGGFGKLASSIHVNTGGIKKSFDSITRSVAGLVAKLYVVKKAFDALWSSVQRSMDFVETFHYFDTAFTKIGKEAKGNWSELGYASAEEYADSFEAKALSLTEKMTGFQIDQNTGAATMTDVPNLGLNPDMLMQYQAQYAQMANSLGMVSESALTTSNALSMLAADWSSLRNIGFDTSYEKMASALAGQTRAVRSLGIDISQATLQQYLYIAGIDTSITKLDGASKAQLRMIAILDQSRVAWGDMAKTLNTPVNQYRLLTQNVQNLSRMIGNILKPVLEKVLPYINGVVIALQHLFAWLAKLLGIEAQASGGTGGMSDTIADMMEDADDSASSFGDTVEDDATALDDATESAEKLKRTILGFDELNVLNDPKSSSSSGSGSGKSGKNGKDDASANIPIDTTLLDSALEDVFDQYKQAWDKALGSLTSKAQEIANKIVDIFKNKKWQELGQTIAGFFETGLSKMYEFLNWDNIGPKIEAITSGITGSINSLVDNFPGYLLGQTVGAMVNDYTDTMNLLYTGIKWRELGAKVGEGMNGLIDEWNPESFGQYISNKITAGLDFVGGFLDEARDHWDLLGEKVATMLNTAIDGVDPEKVANVIGGLINMGVHVLTGLDDKFKWPELADKVSTAINDLVENEVEWDNLGALIGSLINNAFVWLSDVTHSVHWDTLGLKLAEGLNTATDMIKPENVANAISGIINAGVNLLHGLVSGYGWKALGYKISDSINLAIGWIEWDNLGATLGSLFENVLNNLTILASTIKWWELGSDISIAIYNALAQIKPDEIGASIEASLLAALDFLSGAVTKFRDLGGFLILADDTAAFINGALGNPEIWQELGDLLSTSLSGALDFLLRLGEEDTGIHWEDIGTNLQKFIADAVDNDDLWEKAFDTVSTWFDGIVDFLVSALPKEETWAKLGDNIHDFLKGIADKKETWDKAFGGLSDWIHGICVFIRTALPTQEEWKTIGFRIGYYLGKIDWKEVMTTLIEAIKNMVAGLWEGLGETFAGKIIRGIGVFVVTWGLLSPLFSSIGTIITGKIAANYMAGRISTLLGSGLADGATRASANVATNTALGEFAGTIASALATAGAIVGVSLAFLEGCKQIGQGIEILQGGNGEWTDEGNAVDGLIKSIDSFHQLTPQQKEDIWAIKETMETAHASSDEIYTAIIEKLKEFNVSEEEATGALGIMADQGYATDEQIGILSGTIGNLKTSEDIAAEGADTLINKLDFSAYGTDPIEEFNEFDEVLGRVATAAGFNSDQFTSLTTAFENQGGPAMSVQDAYDLICKILGDMGGNVESASDVFRTLFPDAVSAGMGDADTAVTDKTGSIKRTIDGTKTDIASKAVEIGTSFSKGIGDGAENAKSKVDTESTKIVGAIGTLENNAGAAAAKVGGKIRDNIGQGASEATDKVDTQRDRIGGVLSRMTTEADTETKDVKRKITTNIGEGASDSITKAGEMKDEIGAKYEGLNTKTETEFKTLKSGIVGKIGDVKTEANNITTEMANELHSRFKTIGESLPKHFKDLGKDIGDKIGEIDDKVDENLNTDGIKRKFEGLASDIVSAFNNIGNDIASKFSSAFDGIDMYSLGRDMISNLQWGINSVGFKIPHIGWDWKTLEYGDGASTYYPEFKVDWYARGGVFTKPTIAGFGEAGDEAALPLTNKRAMGRIANAIVTSSGSLSGMSDEDISDAVAAGVAMALAQNPQTVEVVVQSVLKTDDERLAQAVSRGRARLDQRYNATAGYAY